MKTQSEYRPDDIYKSIPLDQIPWNSETPPPLLVELLDSDKVKPCKSLDMGCGAGNYVIYLAGRGFDATGVDMSATAVKIAKQNAHKKGIECKFIVADVTGDLAGITGTFDFIYDWGLLHHIMPPQRPDYARTVHRLLNPSGLYLSVCFNERDAAFEGTGKYRPTQFSHKVYLSSEQELRELWRGLFEVLDFRIVELAGKSMSHVFNYCFMRKK